MKAIGFRNRYGDFTSSSVLGVINNGGSSSRRCGGGGRFLISARSSSNRTYYCRHKHPLSRSSSSSSWTRRTAVTAVAAAGARNGNTTAVMPQERFFSSNHIIATTENDDCCWKENIAKAFEERETDGILELGRKDFAASIIANKQWDPIALLRASAQAVDMHMGKTASIVNAWMACCYCANNNADDNDDDNMIPSYVLKLLEAYDALHLERTTFPKADLVTLSLVYATLVRNDKNNTWQIQAEAVLDRAIRMSKKQAGSKRRKVLAASRRKRVSTAAIDVIDDLQSILGADFDILLETDDLLVVNKPAGTSCFHKQTTSAGKLRRKRRGKGAATTDPSLVDALLYCNVPLSTLNPEAQGLVHRLDRGTSGCMVLAKTDDMHAKLVAEFFCRAVQKTYSVVLVPAPSLDRSLLTGHVHGRPAESSYELVEQFKSANAALGRVETYTGRKHQCRVHCASELQSPVLGDDLYGPGIMQQYYPELMQLMPPGAFCLHASSLSIPCVDVCVEAPLPTWWNDILEELRELRFSNMQ